MLARPGKSPLKKDLRTLGVLTGFGRELMGGCVIVPLLRDGQVVNLYGSKTEGNQHLYLPGPRHGLFNARGAKDASRLVLCESIFDALSLLILGEPGAFPLWGVNGWTEDHEAFLKMWTGKDLVLCLDSDDAGKGAASGLAESLALYNPRAVDLGDYKDPNELLTRAQAPQAEWARLVAFKDAPKGNSVHLSRKLSYPAFWIERRMDDDKDGGAVKRWSEAHGLYQFGGTEREDPAPCC